MRIYFDTEFTGLHQKTTLISIGCVAEDGSTFYAECNDYDENQIDDWLRQNVIAHLYRQGTTLEIPAEAKDSVFGDKEAVRANLQSWLHWLSNKNAVFGDARNQFPDRHPQTIEMWSDCLAYDWVLFCELFGGAFGIPKNVYYIPFDLATLFKVKGIDPDISREEYAGLTGGNKHNALWDATVIKACFERAMAS